MHALTELNNKNMVYLKKNQNRSSTVTDLLDLFTVRIKLVRFLVCVTHALGRLW